MFVVHLKSINQSDYYYYLPPLCFYETKADCRTDRCFCVLQVHPWWLWDDGGWSRSEGDRRPELCWRRSAHTGKNIHHIIDQILCVITSQLISDIQPPETLFAPFDLIFFLVSSLHLSSILECQCEKWFRNTSLQNASDPSWV